MNELISAISCNAKEAIHKLEELQNELRNREVQTKGERQRFVREVIQKLSEAGSVIRIFNDFIEEIIKKLEKDKGKGLFSAIE